MTAQIIQREEDFIRIAWSDTRLGFGELTMTWNDITSRYIVDSELMDIDTVIRIFQAIKIKL